MERPGEWAPIERGAPERGSPGPYVRMFGDSPGSVMNVNVGICAFAPENIGNLSNIGIFEIYEYSDQHFFCYKFFL